MLRTQDMNADLGQHLRNLGSTLRIADAVDVLVFAAIVYVALVWFRRARSRFVMLGMAALAMVYAVARVLDLTLTLVLFQAGITVALVALVVIFQEEIRRTFERLGNPSALRKRSAQDQSTRWVDELVASAVSMASSKTGALLVFQGREPLDRHTRGGTALDGRLSQPLLLSIFDSSSPGHDGAVLVKDGWVRSFGLHLPLSTHIAGTEHFGTRHTAALGLSECSDALVLVVSEERGEISLARDGKLDVVDSASSLATRIREHLSSVAPPVTPSRWRPFTRNLVPKVLALAIAAVTWVVVVGPQGERVGRAYRVPITLRHAPPKYMLDQPRPTDVLVTLTGTERAFRKLDPASLVVTLDAASIRPGAQRVRIGQESIDLPRDLVLHRIDPNAVTLVAHETLVRAYPIHAVTEGDLPEGRKLATVATEPEEVRLVVRKRDAGTFSRVHTQPVELDGIRSTTTVERGLLVPPGTRLAHGAPDRVKVELKLAP